MIPLRRPSYIIHPRKAQLCWETAYATYLHAMFLSLFFFFSKVSIFKVWGCFFSLIWVPFNLETNVSHDFKQTLWSVCNCLHFWYPAEMQAITFLTYGYHCQHLTFCHIFLSKKSKKFYCTLIFFFTQDKKGCGCQNSYTSYSFQPFSAKIYGNISYHGEIQAITFLCNWPN